MLICMYAHLSFPNPYKANLTLRIPSVAGGANIISLNRFTVSSIPILLDLVVSPKTSFITCIVMPILKVSVSLQVGMIPQLNSISYLLCRLGQGEYLLTCKKCKKELI